LGGGAIMLDTNAPLNAMLNVSLKLDASSASPNSPAGIANGGYWGIPVHPKTAYHASFYAKAADGFHGPLTVAIIGPNGTTMQAAAKVSKLTSDWKKYEVTLTTKKVTPSKENTFAITTTSPGTIWFQQVSLFPPTFHHRANGNRPDLMQLLADMNPKFLRFPGGNYLEGDYINTRFDWKKTVGDISQRPGHESPWGYWSTDGFGLLEYLNWCEDLQMEPLLAVFAGYALKHDYIKPGPDLEPYVQDALDEIEYVAGDAAGTKWGAQRAKDGHPAPFPLHYVEVGNEDWFDKSGSYDGRFAQFFDAIKAKYPALQVIATTKVHGRQPDLLDEHYYRSQEEMEFHALDYDTYPRTNHAKIFCGEWATRVGAPTPNMAGALGDAAWMTGMERNSDIVLMSCYAPLFVNVSPGGMQWKTDLIGYDALSSYGSPAYYAQKIFSTDHGDTVLSTSSENIPTFHWQPAGRRRNGVEQTPPPAHDVPTLFFDATRDSKSGVIYLKVVNSRAEAQPAQVAISGVSKVAEKGRSITLKAGSADDTNSIEEPMKIIPVTEKTEGLGANFTRIFPPFSITVLELKAE
jgi:alpha-N-arabinofuranosidase